MNLEKCIPLEIIELIVNYLSNESKVSVVVLAHVSKYFYRVSRKYAQIYEISRVIKCEDIALEGYLKVLKWARQNGSKWDHMTSANAALNGHFDMLKWLRKKGCCWNYLTC